jgi:ATP synthase protein I
MAGNDARDGRKDASSATAEDDLSRRLERLGANLDERRPAAPLSGSGRGSASPSALGSAMRASSEFVAGVIAGGGLGWLFDRGLGTKPWGMIVFLMLGFVAGIYNVMRSSGFLKSSSDASGSQSRDP